MEEAEDRPDVHLPNLQSFDATLLDLDGTIYHEDIALPGAMELIEALRGRGQTFAFVSNSSLSPRRLLERLLKMGADVREDQLHTAASAGCDYVRQNFPAGVRVFNVAGEAAADLLDGYASWVEEDGGDCEVVLSSALAHRHAAPSRLQSALRHILRGAIHVAFCADRAYPTPRGFEIGAGAVAKMLAYASNREPIFCGKPEPTFFRTLCHRLKIAPERCVLIGDNLESDVAGARQAGMTSILTMTGVATREDLARLDGDLAPHFVIDDLRDLL